MKKTSAGLLLYRIKDDQLEVMLAHMGAPWWAKKDKGAWTIPKGEYTDEQPLNAAKREFKEELSLDPPPGELIELGEIDQKNNKTVTAWAIEADLDVGNIKSNTFEMEWPPRSGVVQEFPEIDRAAWFDISKATEKIIPAQAEFFERLAKKLGRQAGPQPPSQSSLF
ncbi:MAG TPA: NUDIX domain-containing protein [Candidatus Binatia bacterium]|nr:NUDIX domain-containing protein [Candidatus Binatia bacterium]